MTSTTTSSSSISITDEILFVLGASDPEMAAIEALLMEANIPYVYARDVTGQRVTSFTDRAMRPPEVGAAQLLIYLRCDTEDGARWLPDRPTEMTEPLDWREAPSDSEHRGPEWDVRWARVVVIDHHRIVESHETIVVLARSGLLPEDLVQAIEISIYTPHARRWHVDEEDWESMDRKAQELLAHGTHSGHLHLVDDDEVQGE